MQTVYLRLNSKLERIMKNECEKYRRAIQQRMIINEGKVAN